VTAAEEAPPRLRRRRTRLALGAAGVAIVAMVGAAWIFRLPLVDTVVRDAVRHAGVDADFDLVAVDFGGARVRNLRLGLEHAPDAVAARAEAGLRWGLTGPRLAHIHPCC
jgi:hypothetical protein